MPGKQPGLIDQFRRGTGFWGEASRGRRSAGEIMSVLGGFSTSETILEEGTQGATAAFKSYYGSGARQYLGKSAGRFFGASTVAGKTVGFLSHAGKWTGGIAGVAFTGVDIGTRIMGGEAVWEATAHGIGGGIGGAIGAGTVGGIVGSFIAPGVGTVAGMFIGGMLGSSVGSNSVDPAINFVNMLRETGRKISRPELGGRVSAAFTTEAAGTMRARAMEQIYRAGNNERTLLGREATYMHMR